MQVEGGPVTPPGRTSEIQSSREGLRWQWKLTGYLIEDYYIFQEKEEEKKAKPLKCITVKKNYSEISNTKE